MDHICESPLSNLTLNPRPWAFADAEELETEKADGQVSGEKWPRLPSEAKWTAPVPISFSISGTSSKGSRQPMDRGDRP